MSQDRVDRALSRIAAAEYPGPARNQRVEQAIAAAAGRRRRPPVIICVVAVTLGAGMVAASIGGAYVGLFSTNSTTSLDDAPRNEDAPGGAIETPNVEDDIVPGATTAGS